MSIASHSKEFSPLVSFYFAIAEDSKLIFLTSLKFSENSIGLELSVVKLEYCLERFMMESSELLKFIYGFY